MATTKKRPAHEIREELGKAGIHINYAEMGDVAGIKDLTRETPVPWADSTWIRNVGAHRVPKPATKATKAAKATKATKVNGKHVAKKTASTSSKAPPRTKRKTPKAKAAANLIEYLEQFQVPERFPADLEECIVRGRPGFQGTTVDGEVLKITRTAALNNLARSDVLAYPIPLFGRKVSDEIVELVSELDGAPAENAKDKFGWNLFDDHEAWRSNLLRVGILIWGGDKNPPGLDLKAFPHRRFEENGTIPIETITFRFRSPSVGFVARVKEYQEEEAYASGLTGDSLREWQADWLDEFLARKRKALVGSSRSPKSFLNFRVNGKQGTQEQFMKVWKMLETPRSRRSRR
jgi:hypothetical protein